MSNLVPTPIVDKNGKHTTVRKRAEPKKSKYGQPHALSLPKPAKPGTPLEKTAPLTYNEGEKYWENYLKGKNNVMRKESWYHPDNDEVRVIKRIRDKGAVNEQFLWELISQMGKFSPGGQYPGYKLNMLLMTERYFDLYPNEDQKQAYAFAELLHGTTYRHKVSERQPVVEFTRQEELDSRVAVMHFLKNRPNATYGKTNDFELADHSKIRGTILVGPLNEFIRERPEQVDDVIAYINDRGDVHNRAAVDTMRHYLDTKDEVIPTLQSGWL